jgi:hypothetical protein
MAVVRRAPTNGCVHGPGCPHDIGPTQDLGAYEVDMTVARRPATPEELARLTPPAGAKAVRPGPAMHRVRPATGASSWRNYRSVMGADAPAPVITPEEEPVTPVTPTPTPTPAAIPCGDCIHARVCKHREDLEHAFERIALVAEALTDGPVRISSTADCGDHLVAPAPARTWPEPLPMVLPTRPTAAEIEATSRRRGTEAMLATKAPRYPLPRDRAERDRVVLAAVRETPSLSAAGDRLGVSETRIGQILRVIRADGELPEDVATLLAARQVNKAEPKAVAS